MIAQKQVKLSTDGACIGNPGPGGWLAFYASAVTSVNSSAAIFGCDPHTTNHRMELQAVIEGLRDLREPCAITISTDSQYVQRGSTEWLARWKANGWRKQSHKRQPCGLEPRTVGRTR